MALNKKFFVFAALISGLMLFPFQAKADKLAESRFVQPEFSKRISMDFKQAQLNDVLKIFSQQSGLNFIAAQDVTDKIITLYLDKVPVEEALERILTANNLTYEIQPGSDIFLVKPVSKPDIDVITRVYPLKYATVSSSKLLQTISIETDGGSSTSTSGAANGVIPAVRAVLSSNGKIIEDPRTNSLIVTDVPAQFPLIEQTLARLDVPVPQILIEVEMLDISKTTGDQIGIRYGATPLTFEGAQRQHLYPWNQNRELVQGFEFSEEFTPGLIDAEGLSAALQFIKSQSDTKNLARPRILTMNNETAEIKIATDEAVGLSQSTTSAESTSTSVSGAERVETGVFLTVTPQANLETGEITIAIAPRVIQARIGETFGTQTFKDPEERGTKSILVVRTGETIIMGGLLRTDDENTVTKLPILGDLPFIGGAFRHRDKSTSDRELIIFITPHIVSSSTMASTNIPEPPVYESLTREQDVPASRLNEIEKALTVFERKNL